MKIPFYSNLKDDVHCVQAVLRMILAGEGRNISMRKLDDLTYRHGNQWTWPAAAALAMDRLGFRYKLISGISDMDFEAFAKYGKNYLRKLWTPEVLSAESKHASLALQRRLARRIVRGGAWTVRPATINDIRVNYHRGWHVVSRVNGRALNGKQGFSGHWVLVIAIRNDGLIVHDPGLPGRPNRRIVWKLFNQSFINNLAIFRLK